MDDFEVADCGLAAGAPVDDVGSAIDEALRVEACEGFANRNRKARVHGEVFALPVDGGAEALHLVENGFAVLVAPLPDAGLEGFAAEGLAGDAFAGELALDHHLRGDAGVVGAGNPEGFVAPHAVPAGEDVHLSLVEHVAHVQAAGYVGRRQKNSKGIADGFTGCGRGLSEEVFADPVFGPFIFNGGGVVGFGEVVGHGVRSIESGGRLGLRRPVLLGDFRDCGQPLTIAQGGLV